MTASSQTRQIVILLLVFILLLETASATITTQLENDANTAIALVDVSVGSSEDESACIFKVNGKTVVVNRRETVTYGGVTIYVQEVYAVNTQTQDKDRCEFLYSIAGAAKSTIHEEIVNDQSINFILGTREALEAEQVTEEAKENTGKTTELTGKVVGDNTVVKINGYDVTNLNTETESEEIDKTTISTKAEEPTTFFGKIVRFLFG